MSDKPRYSIIPGDAVRDPRIDGYALKVLALVGSYGGDAGWMWGSQGWMAEQLGMSRPLVHRCLKQLEEFGYVVTRQSEKGRGTKDYKTKMDGEFDLSRTRHVTNRTCHNGDVSQIALQEVSHCVTQIDQEQINTIREIGAKAPPPPKERPKPVVQASPRKAKEPEPKGTRLQEDWEIDSGLIQHAAKLGYSETEARFIADKFKNHWLSATGAKARKADWRRAFMTWVSNETPWKVKQGAAAWAQTAPSGINPRCINPTVETQRKLMTLWADGYGWPHDAGPRFACISDSVLAEFGEKRPGGRVDLFEGAVA